MPRIPNTRPTAIYWLYDTRPETLIAWPNGRPFYCGKTVHDVSRRLRQHEYDACRCDRRVSKWMTLCRGFVRLETVEIVQPGDNWRAREQFWVQTIRVLHGADANMSNGGEGAAGLVFSPEHRAKIAEACRRRIISAETRAKISALRKGRPTTTGRKHSPETIAKMRAAAIGRKQSSDTIAKRVASRLRRKVQANAAD